MARITNAADTTALGGANNLGSILASRRHSLTGIGVMASQLALVMTPVTPFLVCATVREAGYSEHRWKSAGVFRGTRATMLFGPDQTRGGQIGYRDDGTRCGACLAGLNGSSAVQ